MSVKCPHCGLTNFTSGETCKRCKTELPKVQEAIKQAESNQTFNVKRAGIIAAVLIAIGLLIFLGARPKSMAMLEGSSNSSERTETPSISAKNLSSAKSALDAVRRLNSVTEAGINFIEYKERVLTAKADLDAAIYSMSNLNTTERVFADELEDAMDSYIDARDAWSSTIRADDRFFLKDNSFVAGKYNLKGDPKFKSTMDALSSESSYKYGDDYLISSDILPVIWESASKHFRKAVALLPRE